MTTKKATETDQTEGIPARWVQTGTERMNVYECISRATSLLSERGIRKEQRNTHQNYQFRGIDDVYNALSGVLAATHLVILPRMTQREVVERASSNGGALFYVTVTAEFDFISADDGSKHTVQTYGEAMDSGDKATNKAMSAAFKYAMFQTFCIPTEGETHDADATTHTVSFKGTTTAMKPQAGSVDAAERKFKPKDGDTRLITEGQQKRIFAIAKSCNVGNEKIRAMLALSGLESTSDIKRQEYDTFVEWVQNGGILPEPESNEDEGQPMDSYGEAPF